MCLQYKWFSSDAFYLLGDRTMSRPKVRAPSVFGLFACLLVVLAFITSIHADPAQTSPSLPTPKRLSFPSMFLEASPARLTSTSVRATSPPKNPQHRTPEWLAYEIKPQDTETSNRKGKFAIFGNDTEMEGEARDADHKALFTRRGTLVGIS